MWHLSWLVLGALRWQCCSVSLDIYSWMYHVLCWYIVGTMTYIGSFQIQKGRTKFWEESELIMSHLKMYIPTLAESNINIYINKLSSPVYFMSERGKMWELFPFIRWVYMSVKLRKTCKIRNHSHQAKNPEINWNKRFSETPKGGDLEWIFQYFKNTPFQNTRGAQVRLLYASQRALLWSESKSRESNQTVLWVNSWWFSNTSIEGWQINCCFLWGNQPIIVLVF